jgi:tryptophanyl-tRNA synthetase
MKKRVLSGIRASGGLHLGNYLGAIKGMIALQEDPQYETFYMVADAHAITTPFSPEELKKARMEVIIDYLACGLDPNKSTIFFQSDILEHFELAFIFSSITTIARMQHLPTYKDKVKQYPQDNSMALLNYPVLMAADILLYKAQLVPVGIDQEPHLEVAREITRKMNQLYGTDFPEPKRFTTKGEYVPSLNGEGKMSKSVEGSYILLSDSADTIKKKIRTVPTASKAGGEIIGGIRVLFQLLSLFLPEKIDYFKEKFHEGSLQFAELKDALADAIFKELEPIQKRREELLKNSDYLKQVIEGGREKARKVASENLNEVRKKIGLL